MTHPTPRPGDADRPEPMNPARNAMGWRRNSIWRGISAITATYVYFLLFAQFSFLDVLQSRLNGPQGVRAAMAAMGLGGLFASLATAWLLHRIAGRRLLPVAFLACAVVAPMALWTSATAPLVFLAALIGMTTGLLTVTLASSLRDLLDGRHFGLAVGAGTGLAYFICNLPPLFEGTTTVQVEVVTLASFAAAAICAPWEVEAKTFARYRKPHAVPALREADFRPFGFVTLLLSFLVLIWLDSAAFAVIQESLELKGQTWGGGGRQMVLGIVHLLAALAAGWSIDRGAFRSLLLAAGALFGAAFTLLASAGDSSMAAGPIYVTGISLYSVALVAYPAYRGERFGRVPLRWRAALLFGIAGWIGSALGVGMAQDLHRIPAPFAWVTGLVLAAGWLLSHGGATRALARSHALTLAAAVVAIAAYALPHHPPSEAGEMATREIGVTPEDGNATAAAVRRGRAVYIAEGCIHCHSQYVRPAGRDVLWWGPHRPIDRDQRPPLVGNRRQGPDLSTVGARRSAAWHRLHLLDPRSLSPSSRMPSYPTLFAHGSTRGDDLVAYLSSLGAALARERYEVTRTAPLSDLASRLATASPKHGAMLFARHCAPCHGGNGRGNGPLAEAMRTPAMDLTRDQFTLVSWGAGSEPLDLGLARAIRFGIANTSMPGHETLGDREVADLVVFVRTLSTHQRHEGKG